LTVGRAATPGYGTADGVRQQFTSQERDTETGLDYFGARSYASTQGRFTSVDPLMASGLAVDPQSWNRYAYVSNNPLRYVDDQGLVKRDKSGNVVFEAAGSPVPYIHESGQSGIVQYGFIFGEDGTPVVAFRNSPDGNYLLDTNCHGLTFVDGQYWIFNDDVPKLLQADGYQNVEKLGNKPQVGDVVIYTVGVRVVHSATVTAVDDQGNVTAVSGIAGVNVAATTTPPTEGWNDPKAKATYYRQAKDKRTSEQRQENLQRTQTYNKQYEAGMRKALKKINKELGPPPKPIKLPKKASGGS